MLVSWLLIFCSSLLIGAVEYKLFVGSLNKQATEKEVEEVCTCITKIFFLFPCSFFGLEFHLLHK